MLAFIKQLFKGKPVETTSPNNTPNIEAWIVNANIETHRQTRAILYKDELYIPDDEWGDWSQCDEHPSLVITSRGGIMSTRWGRFLFPSEAPLKSLDFTEIDLLTQAARDLVGDTHLLRSMCRDLIHLRSELIRYEVDDLEHHRVHRQPTGELVGELLRVVDVADWTRLGWEGPSRVLDLSGKVSTTALGPDALFFYDYVSYLEEQLRMMAQRADIFHAGIREPVMSVLQNQIDELNGHCRLNLTLKEKKRG